MRRRPDVTLTQLRYFVKAATYSSMTKAADELHIAQSAVSAAISQLEQQIGTQLFIRHRARGLALTAAGEENRVVARILRRGASPSLRAPVAGEELVGPPAEQERVGALVGLLDERHRLAVAHAHGPSAALESVPAVLIRRAAVSLHHSIDGDLRHGDQLHGRASLLAGSCRRVIRQDCGANLIGRTRVVWRIRPGGSGIGSERGTRTAPALRNVP